MQMMVAVWCNHQSSWRSYAFAICLTCEISTPSVWTTVLGVAAFTELTNLVMAKSKESDGMPLLARSRESHAGGAWSRVPQLLSCDKSDELAT